MTLLAILSVLLIYGSWGAATKPFNYDVCAGKSAEVIAAIHGFSKNGEMVVPSEYAA